MGLGGQILGGLFGGDVGSVVGIASQVGATAWATKYSREDESQADILGSQILARAGYEPREMANMFKTIEEEGGGGGPEWLSSHPNPGQPVQRHQQGSCLTSGTGSGRHRSIQLDSGALEGRGTVVYRRTDRGAEQGENGRTLACRTPVAGRPPCAWNLRRRSCVDFAR